MTGARSGWLLILALLAAAAMLFSSVTLCARSRSSIQRSGDLIMDFDKAGHSKKTCVSFLALNAESKNSLAVVVPGVSRRRGVA